MSSTTSLSDVANKIVAVVNRGAVSGSITTSGGSYTIPSGYHNGSGKVTGPTLATLVGTNVNCDSNARLLSGYTAYGKNGVKYTGSIASKGALNWSSSNTTYTVPAGYYTGGTLDSRPSYNAGVAAAATITGAKAIFSYSYQAGVTLTQTCPSNCKGGIGIAVSVNSHSESATKFLSVISTTSSSAINWITNAYQKKAMWVYLKPGNSVTATAGNSASNTHYITFVVVVYNP